MEKERNSGYSSVPQGYESGISMIKEDSFGRARKSAAVDSTYIKEVDEEASTTLSNTPVKKRSLRLDRAT